MKKVILAAVVTVLAAVTMVGSASANEKYWAISAEGGVSGGKGVGGIVISGERFGVDVFGKKSNVVREKPGSGPNNVLSGWNDSPTAVGIDLRANILGPVFNVHNNFEVFAEGGLIMINDGFDQEGFMIASGHSWSSGKSHAPGTKRLCGGGGVTYRIPAANIILGAGYHSDKGLNGSIGFTW